MPTPRILVILPTFNAIKYLSESIESILTQSFDNFELAVLDGGSSDGTIELARLYASKDKRVSVNVFPDTHPCIRSDRYIEATQCDYIAAQHADDISYVNRFAQQLSAFQQDPDLGVCSAVYRSFWHIRTCDSGLSGDTVHAKPETHAEIKANLLFWWVMHLPTLMLDRRKAQAIGWKFTNKFQFGNDYYTTLNAIDKLKFYNIQEELSAYRLHKESDGARNRDDLRVEELELKRFALKRFGFEYNERELELHARIRLIPDYSIGASTRAEFGENIAWLRNLERQNKDLNVFDQAVFADLIAEMIRRIRRLQARATAHRVLPFRILRRRLSRFF